jgi:hypothetical protein
VIDRQRTAARIDCVTRSYAPAGEQSGRYERFQRGSRLERFRERSRRRGREIGATTRYCAHLAAMRIEHDDVPTGRAKSTHCLPEGAFGDVLQILVDRQEDCVSLRRRNKCSRGGVEAVACRVPQDTLRSLPATEDRVQRELEPFDRGAPRIDTPDESPQPLGHRVHAVDRRRGVDATHSGNRRRVRGEKRAGKTHPHAARIDGADRGGRRDTQPLESPPQRDAVADFARRDLEPHDVSVPGQQVTRRVEDLAAGCGERAHDDLLPRCARRPSAPLPELHVRSFHQHCEREEGERSVDESYPPTAVHSDGAVSATMSRERAAGR